MIGRHKKAVPWSLVIVATIVFRVTWYVDRVSRVYWIFILRSNVSSQYYTILLSELRIIQTVFEMHRYAKRNSCELVEVCTYEDVPSSATMSGGTIATASFQLNKDRSNRSTRATSSNGNSRKDETFDPMLMSVRNKYTNRIFCNFCMRVGGVCSSILYFRFIYFHDDNLEFFSYPEKQNFCRYPCLYLFLIIWLILVLYCIVLYLLLLLLCGKQTDGTKSEYLTKNLCPKSNVSIADMNGRTAGPWIMGPVMMNCVRRSKWVLL